jgi:hypothetical protein
MSVRAIANVMRREAAREATAHAQLRLGTVTSYDPTRYAVKVSLQPDGTEAGWMPLAALFVGNGWGIGVGPQIGDTVIVDFQEGAHQAPIAMLRMYGAKNVAMPVPSGEIWAVHQTQSCLKFVTAGDVLLTTNRDLVASVGRNLTATIAGDVAMTATGNVDLTSPTLTVHGDLHSTGAVIAGFGGPDQVGLQTEEQTGVTPGSGISGPPEPGT